MQTEQGLSRKKRVAPDFPAPLLQSTREDRRRGADDLLLKAKKVARGFWIPEDSVDSALPAWQIKHAVTAARATALIAMSARDGRLLLTGEAAALMHGLKTWHSTPDLHFRNISRPGSNRSMLLPEVSMHGVATPPVNVYRHRGPCEPEFDQIDETAEGTGTRNLVSVLQLTMDAARFEHPLVAWACGCSALARLARFSPFEQQQSRERAEDIRRALLEASKTSREHKRSVSEILSNIDPGVDGPGEAMVHWLLAGLLRTEQSPKARFETQFPVHLESDYFLDIGFPELRLGIEFDGVTKTRDYDQGKAWIDRQSALARGGWRLLRVSTPQLLNPSRLADRLAEELSRSGLRVARLTHPAWRPVPEALLRPDRRF